jgi:hypothetical protein
MHVYNDVFIEELVRRERFASEFVVRTLIIAATVVLILAGFIFLRPFSPILTTLFVIAAWLSSRYTVVEYEYSFVNGELDVDKILGKRRRKHILSVNCKTAKAFASEKEATVDFQNGKVIDAARVKGLGTNWILTTAAFDNGPEYLLFSPSERLVEAIKQCMPRNKR